ncbi:MAG: MFS transporter, partial [Nonomuraea sp.]|nr:MFS transporter [Nonomuraea sp.]
RLLTAWSTAGVLGPLIVNWIADHQKEAGKSGASLYGLSFVIMIGLLVVGFVANELVRPVNARHHIPAPREETVDVERQQPESA